MNVHGRKMRRCRRKHLASVQQSTDADSIHASGIRLSIPPEAFRSSTSGSSLNHEVGNKLSHGTFPIKPDMPVPDLLDFDFSAIRGSVQWTLFAPIVRSSHSTNYSRLYVKPRQSSRELRAEGFVRRVPPARYTSPVFPRLLQAALVSSRSYCGSNEFFHRFLSLDLRLLFISLYKKCRPLPYSQKSPTQPFPHFLSSHSKTVLNNCRAVC